ncbi:hypothetical protein [Clostridium sp.]|uniref:hypothetical protein n=1 Tax=Clostridium sp. TaxID=1506 RepID=UPI00260C0477|nr:hypothetical protein [Clostridium sp.]
MNKFFSIMIVILILLITSVTGCYKSVSIKLPNNIKELKFENVKSARIELSKVGANTTKNLIFDFNNSDKTEKLKDIISQLNSAKVQGDVEENVTNKGSSPTLLILELKDGSVIQVKPAVGGKVTKLSDGSTETSQFDIPNEVTITTNSNIRPFRILSPEIRKLIDSGYKDIFNDSNSSTETSQFETPNEITISPVSN